MIVKLDDAKLSLNITWDMSPDEETRLEHSLRRAEAYVTDFSGYPLREDDKVAQQLVLSCLMYIHNNVLSDFQKNYSEDLIMLRAKYMVENANAEETEI